MQRAQQDDGSPLWEGGQGEQRCYQPSAGSHGSHQPPPWQNLNFFALLEHRTHTDLSLPLHWARDGGSSGAVVVDIHSSAAASTQPVRH